MIKSRTKINYKKTKKNNKSKKNRKHNKKSYIGGGGLINFSKKQPNEKEKIIETIFGLLFELQNIKLFETTIIDLLLKKTNYKELLDNFAVEIFESIDNPPEKKNNNKLNVNDLKKLMYDFLGLDKINDILEILYQQLAMIGCDINILLSFEEENTKRLLDKINVRKLDYLRALLKIFMNRVNCFSKAINDIVDSITGFPENITDDVVSTILTSSLNNNKQNKFKYCFQKGELGRNGTFDNTIIPFFNSNVAELEARAKQSSYRPKQNSHTTRERSVVMSSRPSHKIEEIDEMDEMDEMVSDL